MSMTMTLVLMVQVLSALTMIGLILVQQGKGADMGAALGSGSAGSLFGASGSANFLSRMTAVCATVFFASTLALALMASAGMQRTTGDGGPSVLENVPLIAPVETGPAAAIPGADAAPASGTPAQPATAPTGNTTVDAIPGAGDTASTPAQDLAPAAESTPAADEAAPDADATATSAGDEPAEQPAASDAPIAADATDATEPAAGEAAATAQDAQAAEPGNPAAPAPAN